MCSPVLVFHVSGRFCPLATPDAAGPRKDGQLSDGLPAAANGERRADAVRTIRRPATDFASAAGRHVLWSSTVRRDAHGSATTSKRKCVPSRRTLYRPLALQLPGVSAAENSTCAPSLFQRPSNGSQSLPFILNVPPVLNCASNMPKTIGSLGKDPFAS